jgi:hypothetical protein
MRDYVSKDNSLIVGSSFQPNCWPFDESMALQTLRYRINWDSLRLAFLESFDIVRQKPDVYRQMCKQSVISVEKAAGQTHVEELLKEYLKQTAKSCKA